MNHQVCFYPIRLFQIANNDLRPSLPQFQHKHKYGDASLSFAILQSLHQHSYDHQLSRISTPSKSITSKPNRTKKLIYLLKPTFNKRVESLLSIDFLQSFWTMISIMSSKMLSRLPQNLLPSLFTGA